MTASQPKRPPPPDGWASWLDYLLQLSRPPALLLQSHWTATVGELAELRQALVDAERQRDKANAALALATTRQCYIDRSQAEKERDALQAELSELRADRDSLRESLASAEDAAMKELSDTQGLLAIARENLVAIDAQRANAVREMVEAEDLMHEAIAANYKLKALLVRCVNDGTDGGADDDVSLEFLSHVPAECAAIKKQRDSLRAQVAELRGAVLGMGILHYCGELLECAEEHVCAPDVKRFNALVAKLRAEARGAAEPNAGEQEMKP